MKLHCSDTYSNSGTSAIASQGRICGATSISDRVVAYDTESTMASFLKEVWEVKCTCTTGNFKMFAVIVNKDQAGAFADGFYATLGTTDLETWIETYVTNSSDTRFSVIKEGISKYNGTTSAYECFFKIDLTKLMNKIHKRVLTDSEFRTDREIKLGIIVWNGAGLTNPSTIYWTITRDTLLNKVNKSGQSVIA